MFLLRASMAAFMYGMFSSEERKFLMSSSRFKNVSNFVKGLRGGFQNGFIIFFSLLAKAFLVLGTYQKSGVTWAYFERMFIVPGKGSMSPSI